MRVKAGTKKTKLRTKLSFYVYDFRGTRGFPKGDEGFCFEHREKRVIYCKYTGVAIKRDARYLIRTDDTGKGWRIDEVAGVLACAVYGVDRESYWPSNVQAACALQAYLEEIRTTSSVGSR